MEETTIGRDTPISHGMLLARDALQEALAIVTCSIADKIGKITNAFARQLSHLLVLLFEATQKAVDKDGVAAIKEHAGAVSPVLSEATVVFPFDVVPIVTWRW